MGKKKTTEQFIEEAKAIHCDKYDYSETVYVKALEKVTIYCNTCNKYFSIRASAHIDKYHQGCSKCADRATADKNRCSLDKYIAKAVAVHGDKYDYSEVVYIDNKTRIKIFCKVCNEFFWKRADVHVGKQKQGCLKCVHKSRRKGKCQFIKEAIAIHGDKYCYDKIDYVNNRTDVRIYCRSCQEYFYQTPHSHCMGHHCQKCASNSTADKLRKTLAQFVIDAIEKHGYKYGYSEVEYVTCLVPVKIFCKTCQGYFYQTPASHLDGHGCQACAIKNRADGRRKSLGAFISESAGVHGNRYDYSEVVYVNSNTLVDIICKTCGETFKKTPCAHLNGYGCRCHCTYAKSNTKSFIREATIKHGDKYDYSLVDYRGSASKVNIVCCGCNNIFSQTPSSHLKTIMPCSYCRGLYKTKEQFIDEAIAKHGNKYDYSKVVYSENRRYEDKEKIFCKTCQEYFYQTPASHLKGHGCQKCSVNERARKISSNTEEFISRAMVVHGSKYDYSGVEYVNSNEKVKIFCKQCSDFFYQTPHHHLGGHICQRCSIKDNALKRTCTTEEFILKACEIYGDKYNYSKVEYRRSDKNVTILCKKCGNIFETTPSSHLGGRGCSCYTMVLMEDGTVCPSLIEALWYLRIKNSGKKFKHNNVYGKGLGGYRYDFYLVDEDTYIEVTAYSKRIDRLYNRPYWFAYLRKIANKKKYVEEVLGAKFKFIQQTSMTALEYKYVRQNEKRLSILKDPTIFDI